MLLSDEQLFQGLNIGDCSKASAGKNDFCCADSPSAPKDKPVSISRVVAHTPAGGEPLKVVALVVAGKGHWLTGTGMLVVTYAASLLVVERLFKLVKPKLMMMDWFARLWTAFVVLRIKFLGGWSGKRP